MNSAGLTLIEERTLLSCASCRDVVPDWLGQVSFDDVFRCRPCLISTVRDDLVLLAVELAS